MNVAESTEIKSKIKLKVSHSKHKLKSNAILCNITQFLLCNFTKIYNSFKRNIERDIK